MSVELRCPDCRAKLRLPKEPEPGTDVECPECDAVFPAPDLATGGAADARTKKKPKKDGDAKVAASKPKPKSPPKDKTPKKRKAKKKETNKGALIGVIVGAVAFLGLVVGLLGWYFSRTPPSYVMMKYLPEDATSAVGVNVGHLNKYSALVQKVEGSYNQLGFFHALEAVGQAMDEDLHSYADYTVEGWGPSGGALVIRTKKEFDPQILAKLPGAAPGKLDDTDYYSISPITKLFGGQPLKAFAPTNRFIVICEYSISNGMLSKMMAGNPDGDTLPKRLGALGKRVTRGTYWWFSVMNDSNRWKEPEKGANPQQTGGDFMKFAASSTTHGTGQGLKFSLGSHAIRFEYVLWVGDAEFSGELSKKFKENEIHKAMDDSSLDPPKWWKEFAQNIIGDKKAAGELMQNLSGKSSGELFILSSECDTNIMMGPLSGIIKKMTGQTNSGPNAGMMNGGMNGGGRPGGQMPMPGNAAPPPL